VEDFSDPQFSSLIAECFPALAAQHGPSFPQRLSYRKHWEVAMAVEAFRRAGALGPEAEILGIGAGNEATAFILTNYVRRVFATDLYLDEGVWQSTTNRNMLRDPGSYWTSPWQPRRLVVQHLDARDLRFDDDSFHGVFSSSSVEHFGDRRDVIRSLTETFRVLRPGGVLSISTEFRIDGPGPGLDGTLLFDAEDVEEIFLQSADWEPLDALDLQVTAATLANPSTFSEALADIDRHLQHNPEVRPDDLFWRRYPHVLISDGEHLWTSIHLALRRPTHG
jgi:SAM-dependent methyltransferase